jgi:hypothetical protein
MYCSLYSSPYNFEYKILQRDQKRVFQSLQSSGASNGFPFGQSSFFFISSFHAMHDRTIVKTQLYDVMMMKTRWYHGENTMVPWWNRDVVMVKMRCNIAFFHHTIAFSPSRHRLFAIVPSRFHHRAIAFSPSYHRAFTICNKFGIWWIDNVSYFYHNVENNKYLFTFNIKCRPETNRFA